MDEVKNICVTYDKIGSIKGTARQLEISWNRVVKVLSSEGYVLNDKHEQIIMLHNQGLSIQEIADKVKQSKNAQRIARWRANKEE